MIDELTKAKDLVEETSKDEATVESILKKQTQQKNTVRL